MSELIVKRHDTWPPVKFTLEETNAENKKVPINLTGAESITLILKRENEAPIEIPASVVGEAKNGEAEASWLSTAESTAVAGKYNAEAEIKWTVTHIETVPNKGYDTITIEPDLGTA